MLMNISFLSRIADSFYQPLETGYLRKLCRTLLCIHGHVSAGFFSVTYSRKENTTVFVILLQLLRELEFDDNIIIIIQVKASKFATHSQNSLYAFATI